MISLFRTPKWSGRWKSVQQVPRIVVIEKLLCAVSVASASLEAFSVVCQYHSLMRGLVSVMAWSYTIMSQKGQWKHQGHFSHSSPVADILVQINSHVCFCKMGSTFFVFSWETVTLCRAYGLSSAKGGFRSCKHRDCLRSLGLVHDLKPFVSTVREFTGCRLPI